MLLYSGWVYLLHIQPLPPRPHLPELVAIGADSHRPRALALPFTTSLALVWCSLRCSGTDAKLAEHWINCLFIIIHVVWLYTRETKNWLANGVCLHTLLSKAMTVNANTGPQRLLTWALLAVQSETMTHWLSGMWLLKFIVDVVHS